MGDGIGKGVCDRGGGTDDAGAAVFESRVKVGGGAVDEVSGAVPGGCSVKELA